MHRREFIHSGPIELPEPPKDSPGHYTACLVHDGENFAVRFIRPEAAPAFINPKTGEIRYLMLPILWGRNFSQPLPHQKVKFGTDDELVSADGQKRYKQWNWSEWVPYSPPDPPKSIHPAGSAG